jgi:hypothetical protein
MAERYDTDARDAEAAEYLPLPRAAALVYARLFPQDRVKDVKTLDLLGVAISARVSLYQRDMKSSAVRALKADEIAHGRFARGASRLELPDRPPLTFLLVARAEFYSALEAVVRDPLLATLRSTSTRPRPPGYSSARGA